MKEQVSIRPWRLADASDLAAVCNNQKVQDNLRDGLPFPYTKADAAWYINACLGAEPDTQYGFAILRNDRAIGSICVFRKDNIHRLTGELGYYIGAQHWGNGYATEAVRQICRHIFENTDIVRIFAEPFASNVASCRVLEKAGFACEGTLRANAVKKGRIVDMRMWALVKGDKEN